MRVLANAVGNWMHRPVGRRACLYPFIYMVILFWLSSISDVPLPEEEETFASSLFQWVSPNVQNLLHIPLYALLSVLWCRSLRAWRFRTVNVPIVAFLLSALYGVLDEWHQSFIPGRYSSATDSALDALGAALGTWFYLRLFKTRDP